MMSNIRDALIGKEASKMTYEDLKKDYPRLREYFETMTLYHDKLKTYNETNKSTENMGFVREKRGSVNSKKAMDSQFNLKNKFEMFDEFNRMIGRIQYYYDCNVKNIESEQFTEDQIGWMVEVKDEFDDLNDTLVIQLNYVNEDLKSQV